MKRVLYVVSREQPLLCGYLMTTAGARSAGGHLVEIKLDERRIERRLSAEARDPERRRGEERRRRPSLDRELRSRGYATVAQSEAGPSPTVDGPPARRMAWRRRSSLGQRAVRAGRRNRVGWGGIALLLVAAAVAFVVTRSMDWVPVPRASAPPVAPEIEKAAPPPTVSRAETVVPRAAAPPPPRRVPDPIVTTRSSGVVLSVDPRARLLVLEDRGAAGEAARLRIELAPDARVLLSERADQPADPSRPFKDTTIDLSDVRRGDYVVVERRGPEGKALARSVVVTFRANK